MENPNQKSYQDDHEPNELINTDKSGYKKKQFIIMSVFVALVLAILLGGVYVLYDMVKPKEAYTTESLKLDLKEEDNTIESQKQEILSEQLGQEPIRNEEVEVVYTPPPTAPMPVVKAPPKQYFYGMNEFKEDQNKSAQQSLASDGIAKTTKYNNSSAEISNIEPSYRLGKGRSLLCTLQTKIDTSYPGIVTCLISKDVYSDDGKIILIDKGSMVIGEQSGGSSSGQRRVFVSWSEIRTPENVLVSIDSPMSDSLGASGVDGKINNQFFKKFLVGTMISLIGAGEDYVILKNSKGNEVTLNNRGDIDQLLDGLSDELIEQPTLKVNPGTPVNIHLVRDLDFSGVYQ
ncbi:MAG: hypothetical protein N4Q32_00065 [Neisseriaceae bacterium]|nr:hypothetical protein [Neisseriaceae bacterium]